MAWGSAFVASSQVMLLDHSVSRKGLWPRSQETWNFVLTPAVWVLVIPINTARSACSTLKFPERGEQMISKLSKNSAVHNIHVFSACRRWQGLEQWFSVLPTHEDQLVLISERWHPKHSPNLLPWNLCPWDPGICTFQLPGLRTTKECDLQYVLIINSVDWC